ncbi:MAG: hypothetical protein R2789_17850 [Microthrixaceae bacterium]
MLAANQRIWGFETNYGGLADLSIVKANQLDAETVTPELGDPRSTLCARSTSYRMLVGETTPVG